MTLPPYTITAEGDSGLAVRFAATPDVRTADAVAAAAQALENAQLPSPCELVPSYTAVTIFYDPLQATYSQMRSAVEKALDQDTPHSMWAAQTFVLPVCYGVTPQTRDFGPDLEALATRCGLSHNEVVRIHTQRTYRIDMLGFMPGFAYLSGLDERLRCPRLSQPRTHIPAGSVGIGNDQTGVYPLASPGGWNLIGRTPARLFDPTNPDTVPYRPGDLLRFEAIDSAEFYRLATLEAQGTTCLRREYAGGETVL